VTALTRGSVNKTFTLESPTVDSPERPVSDSPERPDPDSPERPDLIAPSVLTETRPSPSRALSRPVRAEEAGTRRAGRYAQNRPVRATWA